ncbi:uncharacterized protein [Elaeis guineensis]|uniref:Uncharacterized protein LOC109506555 isoform X2 n=1 Tax=Elaeis guineensis var. tenera TaxID=51953 RepID=A0A6J0PQM0_ELAGV|nr:uncharacterized protein LOC109506555 isoform X2 [Elaeis guineensis]XP_019710090.1 uncharacterized protein LOC109506555 isoform X2 [Elaeis guineensis]XP_019710091.1 uncharacterized protein LOC109506555 isoform X2 [Elaeis guineensis]
MRLVVVEGLGHRIQVRSLRLTSCGVAVPAVAISRALNGIGLALVVPAIQSLIADSTDDSTRGIAFGWLQLTGNIGSILGNFFALLLASTSIMGIAGWRIAFHLVAIISVAVGIFVRLFAVDPHFSSNAVSSNDLISRKCVWAEVKDLIKEAKAVMRIPSFQIIVAQGVTGSFPWSALSFAPMWLEIIGFSHKVTGLLMTLFSVATSLGALFGGKMGDFLARHFPNSGRIVLSQISSGSAIPLAAVLLLVLPDDPSTGLAHAIVLFIMGLSMSWNVSATNSPIFAEIVPERSRTSIYALDRSFESILASFAPPVVGILAEHVYGYKPVSNGSGEGTAVETDKENATSLAKALYIAIAIPMSLCCSIYSFLYCTYPRDRERARMESLIASELQHMELEIPLRAGGYSQIQLSEPDLYKQEPFVLDMVFGEENIETDENGEKKLLSDDVVLSDARG